MSLPAGSVYFPPPPPSPSSPSYTHGQRRPQQPVQPPAITTDLSPRYGTYLNAQQTPASAVHGHSPFSPTQPGPGLSNANPSLAARTSPSTMNTYNPQEWRRGGSVAGQYVPHGPAASQSRPRGTRDATGMESSLPEPPPPYSASASPNTTRPFHSSPQTAQFAQSSGASPIANSPNANSVSPAVAAPARQPALDTAVPASATQPGPPMSFPPPPGSQRDRSASRTRGMLTNIAAFATSRTRASDNASPANVVETFARQRSESITRMPAAVSRPGYIALDQLGTPAAARRSASVGVTTPSQERSASQVARDRSMATEGSLGQGMPLPGPPPGPPPSSRSQSMNRVMDRSINAAPDPSIVAPIPTRVARGSTLGPVPPTPADWVDEDLPQAGPSDSSRTPLRLDTQQTNNDRGKQPAYASVSQSAIEPSTSHSFYSGSQGGLVQAQIGREPSLSIRDRRNEARARSRDPMTAVEPSHNNSWPVGPDEAKPANLILSSSTNSGLGRRRHVSKAAASPRSAPFSSEPPSAEANETPASSKSSRTSPLDSQSKYATSAKSGGMAAPTPPFSPESEAKENAAQFSRGVAATSTKALPTPPSRDSSDLSSAKIRNGKDSASQLDASPLESGLRSAPLNSARSVESRMSAPANKLDVFAQASLERFEKFLHSEMSASDDQERLELFAEFAVNESRLRRDRYAAAFEGMGSDVLDLTRDLWRSFSTSKRSKAAASTAPSQPQISAVVPPSRSETATPVPASSASSPGSAAFTPGTEPESPGGAMRYPRGQRSESQRQGSFQPMLSPIPSMAMSTLPDESDSRGRAASRWWEQSDDASFGPGGRKIERSKRESKYMGVPREGMEYLQWDNAEPSPGYATNGAGPSNQYQNLGPNEYPPEKTGWHEEVTPSHTSAFMQTPSTPQPRGLDVSRLITLPPPFPRHHPAVNNSHPDLAAMRANLRAISDTEEPASYFERYATQYPEQSPSLDPGAIAEHRKDMRKDIQTRVASGEMSFADAAKAETEFEDSAAQNHRETAQKNFDNFQKAVLKPLQAILTERISNATASYDSLRESILVDITPDQTQEEGDERPEQLEKITLMKWIFEARETLHKDLFELQNQSDEKYKHVILAPYRVSGNDAKVTEVQGFFDRDSRDRLLKFHTKAVTRYEALLKTVEDAVGRGVEAQLSAFWDIAPGLLAVVQKVPTDEARLHTFDVLIPAQELVENPPYADFPLQYLYSLLLHAEKSAYQFIESQTNLLCLLHEVKSALMLAGCRVLELQRVGEASADDAAAETAAVREAEDRRLTRELKDRVDVVEDQWRSALGAAFGDCKARTGAFLVQVGGWDDGLEE